ncbi:hypothetical protein [Microbacterium deminutum]
MDRDAGGKPEPVALVTAATPDARITSVHDAGDEFSFVVALNAVADAYTEGVAPTPFTLAVELGGRGATVHQVLDDGTLRGWRRDYGHLEPGITTGA